MDYYLIENTTKEERKKFVEDALAISLLDAGHPDPKTMTLTEAYINGEIEIDDLKRNILDIYKQKAAR